MSKQMQFAMLYQPSEDRILLRVRFSDGAELKFLFTRRIVKGLLEIVDQIAEAQIAGDVTAEQKTAMADFSREHAVSQGDFQSPYKMGREHPDFGSAPKLLKEIKLTPLQAGKIRLNLQVEPKSQLNFELPTDAFWGLVHLFSTHAERGGWNLEAPRYAQQTPDAGPLN